MENITPRKNTYIRQLLLLEPIITAATTDKNKLKILCWIFKYTSSHVVAGACGVTSYVCVLLIRHKVRSLGWRR